MAAGPVSSSEFRRALGHFATGVTVLTVEREAGHVHGMTANSFASVSLEPPLVSVCVDHRARLLPMLKEKQRFGVNVLRREQQAFSEFFARIEQDPEALERLGVKFFWTEQKIPLLENVLCQLSCKLSGLHVAGDHTIVIAEVESAKLFAGEPLLFYRGQYHCISEKP
ncbi:MAG TPA: flavin reductase family protein [Candidatus Dormibacteraeota bacterium]|jgi:flavin reductase (DIM6/NTAB) family NADH-FMN oxidoreductase RutF|nr:flavin reductase family protein [Candidatus Dormibacteraeota bacterium]